MRLCILSQQKFKNKHVSEDTVDAFETTLCGLVDNVDVNKIDVDEKLYKIERKKQKTFLKKIPLIDLNVLKKINKLQPQYVFIMAMSYTTLEYQLNTLKYIKRPIVVYAIDTWSMHLNQWRHALTEANIDILFCSNKASVPIFKQFIKHVFYLPYAANEKWFYPRDNMIKTHLFMQMGRKNKTLHEYALTYIREQNLNDDDYIREKRLGQIIYPEFSQLAEEINKTRFFILAPRDVDESQFTGAISDVTARFYEGMACKTLLVGYKPKDSFNELFPNGYAMITVDSYECFRDKINYYLEHEKEYNTIVDQNYRYLMQHHTWNHRAKQLIKILEQI